MILFSKSIDETWRRAEPNGAFEAYNENLKLLLDVIENIELENIPPALLETIVYNLDKVSYYIGTARGRSRSAYYTWQNRKESLPRKTINEIYNIGLTRSYHDLIRIVEPLFTNS